MTPEGSVKKAISRVLLEHDDVYFYMPVPSGYGKATLDYIGCSHGRFFGIEAKAPGKNVTTRQERTIDDMRKAGATVFVIDGPGTAMDELTIWLTHGSN
jgi:hypothetical protein